MSVSDEFLDALRSVRWGVEINSAPIPIPDPVASRYGWLPDQVRKLITCVKFAAATDDRSWLVTSQLISGHDDSVFAWNEWERMSLESASDDEFAAQVRQFWGDHFPLIYSVRSGYEYLAIRRCDLAIVAGMEPEFEETSLIASSLSELAHLIVANASTVRSYFE